jgi:polysaccharide pyruvyl transferase WcaK-like protein
MRPEETERIHGVHAIAPLRAPLELLSHSAVIIGGGGIFSGHMGQMSRLLPVMSLVAWLARKRVAYYGVGVYNSTPNWVKKTLRLAMRKANLVTVRDTPSIETLTAMGVKAELRPDLATLLEPKPFPASASAMRAFERKPGRPLVGLCLTATDTALGEAMDRAVPEVVSRMPDADFVFIPMSQHPVINSHNDMLMAMAIQESAPRMRILDGYHHPGAVMDAIGRLDAAVCMRFHSMVFAERMGTPIVPVSYAEKTLSWLEERGVQSVEPNAETLTGAIRRALSSRRVSEAV